MPYSNRQPEFDLILSKSCSGLFATDQSSHKASDFALGATAGQVAPAGTHRRTWTFFLKFANDALFRRSKSVHFPFESVGFQDDG